MPLDERLIDQNDPNLDTIADLQRALKQTLHYIMGLASVAELYGLQGYLSKLASQMTPPDEARQPGLLASDAQVRETYHQSMLRQGLASAGTPAP